MRRRRDPLYETEERVEGTLGLIRDYVWVEIMMLRSASAPFCQQSYRHKQTRHLLFSLLQHKAVVKTERSWFAHTNCALLVVNPRPCTL